MLIPVFNFGWQFYLLHSATKGVKGRLAELGRDPGDGGFGFGVAYQSLFCLVALLSLGVRLRSELGVLVGALFLAAIVTWIIYWIRISRLNRTMESTAPHVLPTVLAG